MAAKNNNEASILKDMIIANGINGTTKTYLTPPMSPAELLSYILDEKLPPDYDRLQQKEFEKEEGHLGLVHGVDAKKLDSAGWGVIYAPGISPEIKEALSPLINLRRQQAGSLFKEYPYQVGWPSRTFLIENNTGLGPADPEEMPYYLLIVGSPQEIPYNFQYELDVDRAVGRLYFDTPDEYHNYALSVVAAEKGEVKLPARADFFSAANPNDVATQLSTDLLLEPLYKKFNTDLKAETRDLKWEVHAHLKNAATRSQLEKLLGGDPTETPAFLFTGGHGMGFNRDDPYQLAHQGALICQDWDGNPASISEQAYLAGDHIANDARLHGLIAFFFACYGAGTPNHDEFMRKVEGTPKKIAPQSFVARLPRRLLSHPQGGALAVIGHIERAWTHSFKWSGQPSAHRAHFTGMLGRLFDGYPVGFAFDQINERHASAAVQLTGLLNDKRNSIAVNDLELIQTWAVNNDARDYIILGDPAVRLCVPETKEEAVKPSTLTLKDINLDNYKPGAGVMAQPSADGANTAAPIVANARPMSPQTDDAEAMGILSEAQMVQIKDALKTITQQVAAALHNVSTLEVLTYLSDDDLENVYDRDKKAFRDHAKLKAVTLIGLDGDIQSMIPARQVETLSEAENQVTMAAEVDKKLLNLHKDMVELAQANRAVFLKNLAEIAVTLVNTQL